MIPEQSLGHLLFLLSLLLASTLAASSTTRPSDPVDISHNATGSDTVVTMTTAPYTNRNAETATLTSQKSIQNSTTTNSPIPNQNGTMAETVSNKSIHNNAGASTIPPSATQDSPPSTDSEVLPGATVPGQTTRMTVALTTSAKAVFADPATNPPSTAALTTTRAQTTSTSTSTATPRKILTSASPDITDAVTPMATTVPSTTLDAAFRLNISEQTMTIFFSVLLGVAALVIFLYALDRCKRKQTQYLHRPLYNNSEDTGERFVPADDTLVISGGLYDGPRVYNPTMTTTNEDDDFHYDQPSFASRPTQFQLELLKEEREKPPGYEASTFQRFQPMEEDA